MKAKLLLLYLLLAAHCGLTTATIRYVSKTGSSTPPYTSWLTAADSIQKCINICQNGDTIYVANGVYKEKVLMKDGLSLIGSGMDSCIIDTRELYVPGSFIAVRIDTNCVIDGFNIIVSYGKEGNGILGDGDNVIKNNKINNAGIGIWIFNSNGDVSQNIIENCRKGILIEAFFRNYFPEISNNIIYYPQGDAILKAVGTCPKIFNNVIFLNYEFSSGIFLSDTDSIFVNNNLIFSVNAQYGIANSLAYLTNYNNYLEGNFSVNSIMTGDLNVIKNNCVTNGVIGIERYGQTSPIIMHNNSWNNTFNYYNLIPDSTNLSVNPMIVNRDILDFHLQKYSPLIDAGDPNILDLDGTRSDIGLYGGPYGQTYKYRDLPPAIPKNFIAHFDSLLNRIVISWVMNTEADFANYKIYKDTTTGFIPDSVNLYTSTDTSYFEDIVTLAGKNFYYRISAVDSQGNESNSGEEIAVILVGLNEPQVEIIKDFVLFQNYPNPFNPTTRISYRIKESGNVRLTLYDIKGEKIQDLVNEFQEGGIHEVEFNIDSNKRLSSGIYIYRIEVINQNNHPVFRDMKKMILIK